MVFLLEVGFYMNFIVFLLEMEFYMDSSKYPDDCVTYFLGFPLTIVLKCSQSVRTVLRYSHCRTICAIVSILSKDCYPFSDTGRL